MQQARRIYTQHYLVGGTAVDNRESGSGPFNAFSCLNHLGPQAQLLNELAEWRTEAVQTMLAQVPAKAPVIGTVTVVVTAARSQRTMGNSGGHDQTTVPTTASAAAGARRHR